MPSAISTIKEDDTLQLATSTLLAKQCDVALPRQTRSPSMRTCHRGFVSLGARRHAFSNARGSTSPLLRVRELTLMIFDSIAMNFKSAIKTFDSIAMIFDSVVMTFESSIKIF
jgi:hypothetical protein